MMLLPHQHHEDLATEKNTIFSNMMHIWASTSKTGSKSMFEPNLPFEEPKCNMIIHIFCACLSLNTLIFRLTLFTLIETRLGRGQFHNKYSLKGDNFDLWGLTSSRGQRLKK